MFRVTQPALHADLHEQGGVRHNNSKIKDSDSDVLPRKVILFILS